MRRPPLQPDPQQGETIATFGQARLVKLPNGTYDLVGGSPDDRSAAAEWIHLFMKNDVVHGLPPSANKDRI